MALKVNDTPPIFSEFSLTLVIVELRNRFSNLLNKVILFSLGWVTAISDAAHSPWITWSECSRISVCCHFLYLTTVFLGGKKNLSRRSRTMLPNTKITSVIVSEPWLLQGRPSWTKAMFYSEEEEDSLDCGDRRSAGLANSIRSTSLTSCRGSTTTLLRSETPSFRHRRSVHASEPLPLRHISIPSFHISHYRSLMCNIE